MREELRKEYEAALLQATLANGTLLDPPGQGSGYGWGDYQATYHGRECGLTAAGTPFEDIWYEFVSGGGPEDGRTQGITVTGVNCSCGLIHNRQMRWQAHVSEVAEAVFEIALGPRR